MVRLLTFFFFSFFFNDTATTEIYTLSLHDALPICLIAGITLLATDYLVELGTWQYADLPLAFYILATRSEEHTSELQSHSDIVCRLLLEKKNKKTLPRNFSQTLSICETITQISNHTDNH